MDALTPELKSAIKRKAANLKSFKISGRRIGKAEAEKRLTCWASNFLGFLDDMNPLIAAINHIDFISDEQIVEDLTVFAEKNLPNLDMDIAYFCPFGSANESSHRIMAPLNTKVRYKADITEALDELNDQTPLEKADVVFLDDFLNSGGQFETIIRTWFGKTERAADTPACTHTERKQLSDRQLHALKNSRLHFFFSHGMERGRIHARKIIRHFDLDANVYVIEQTDDQRGIFGKPQDLMRIERASASLLGASSIFCGMESCQVTKFLSICAEAGEQLLRSNKPKWAAEDPSKYEDRRLGYGNSAKLHITQNNIPTSTLTCFWLDGEVRIADRVIQWQPVFRRREKSLGGREGPKNSYMNSKALPDLKDTFLDELSNSSFDLMLIGRISGVLNPDNHDFTDLSDTMLSCLMPDLKENLLLATRSEPLFRALQLNPRIFSLLNNRLSLKVEKLPAFQIRLKSVMVISFCGTHFMSVRFQGKGADLKMEDVLVILNRLRKNLSSQHYFQDTRGCFSFQDLACRLLADAKTECFMDSKDELSLMAYLRTRPGFFAHSESGWEYFFNLLADFTGRGIHLTGNSSDTVPHYPLKYDARFSANRRGSICLCDGIHKVNQSWLADRFMKDCACIYLMGLHRQILEQVQIFGTFTEEEGLPDWRRYYEHFGKVNYFREDYLNGFCELVSRTIR